MRRQAGTLLLGVLLVWPAQADWPQFRGPEGTGVAHLPDLPWRWSRHDNVRWCASLPGRGVSSPVVAGNRVYVSACSGANGARLHLLCFDASNGRLLWQRQFWATGPTTCHPKTCLAAPTPVATQEAVYALFSSGDLFCLDQDGVLLWCRTLAQDYPAFTNDIGLAASPVLAADVLVVPLENPGESLVVGLDSRTGRTRWQLPRPKDSSWTTPLVWRRPAGTWLVLQSGTRLSAHAPQTGQEYWRWSERELAKIPSPVAAGTDLLLVAGREALLALHPGPPVRLVWQSAKLRPAMATPLVHQDRLYTINSAGILSCAAVASGKILWQLRLPGPFSASPVLNNDKIYLVNEEGVTQVVQLGDKPQLLSTNALEPTMLATPALAAGALFLRSDQHLFCIGGKAP